MKKLTIVLVNSNLELVDNDDIEIIKTDSDNTRSAIENANGKYITFICNNDEIADNYMDLIYQKTDEEFDSCYIQIIEILKKMLVVI